MSFGIAKYPTLILVDSIQELRLLPKESLPKPYDELCHYLSGGMGRSSEHFISGLGTVELTMALHYIYNTPFDQLVWDVRHQAYPHKILAGRHDKIDTIRQRGGPHPLPWRGENGYDMLNVGHSSTSISAGIGTAVVARKESKNRRTVCVIGDGTVTAGMTFEAMNRAGDIRPDMLVALNDNEMSISENVGVLNDHLAQLLSGKLYPSLREGKKKVSSGISPIRELLKRTEEHTKGMVVPGTLFEELGSNHIGPADGHDALELITTLRNMRDLKDPQFLHIMIKKGRGYESAEKDPITFRTVSKFNPSSGCSPKSSDGLPSYSKIFNDWLCEMAAKDNRLMAITSATREGSGMVELSRKFLDHYSDTAVVEQHMVTFTVGLAIDGYKPIVAIYPTFLQRAYDQVLYDMTIQEPPALSTIGRAGIVDADGQTHQDTFDFSCLRCISEMVIMTPSDENKCHQMFYTGYHYNDGLFVVHYPRSNAVGVELTPLEEPPIGKGIVKRRGGKLAIPNFGTLMSEVTKIAESLSTTLVDIRFVKPLDEVLILGMAASHEALVTIEKNAIMGGADSGVSKVLMVYRKPVPVLNIGLSDFLIPQGTREEMCAEFGLDAADVEAKIKVQLA